MIFSSLLTNILIIKIKGVLFRDNSASLSLIHDSSNNFTVSTVAPSRKTWNQVLCSSAEISNGEVWLKWYKWVVFEPSGNLKKFQGALDRFIRTGISFNHPASIPSITSKASSSISYNYLSLTSSFIVYVHDFGDIVLEYLALFEKRKDV